MLKVVHNDVFDPYLPFTRARIMFDRCTTAVHNLLDRDQLAVAERRANCAARILCVALARGKIARLGLDSQTGLFSKLVWRAVEAQARGMGIDTAAVLRQDVPPLPEGPLRKKLLYDLGMYCALAVFNSPLINSAPRFINAALKTPDTAGDDWQNNAFHMRQGAVEAISHRARSILHALEHPALNFRHGQMELLGRSAGNLFECAAQICDRRPEKLSILEKAERAYRHANDSFALCRIGVQARQCNPG